MGESAWLEGVAGDLEGEALPAALIEWKNTLPEALREVCNRVATEDGGIWLVVGHGRGARRDTSWEEPVRGQPRRPGVSAVN